MTGSCNVITLNINRIVQDYIRSLKIKRVTSGTIGNDSYIEVPYEEKYHNLIKGQWYKDNTELKEGLKSYLIGILERVYKYHIAVKTMRDEQE